MKCVDEKQEARVQTLSNQCIDCLSMMSKWYCPTCRIFSDIDPEVDVIPFYHCTQCTDDGVDLGVGYCNYASSCPHGAPKGWEKTKKEVEAARASSAAQAIERAKAMIRQEDAAKKD